MHKNIVYITFLLSLQMIMKHLLFLSLYEEYADDLLSYGRGLGYEKEDIEDAIQDIIVNLYIRDPQLKEIRNVKVYLFTALKNRLLNTTRRQRMDSIDDGSGRFDVSVTVNDIIIDEEERHQLQRRVEIGLSQLTPRQREAVYLRYMQEMDYDSIAQLLHMTKPSVRNLVSKGLMEMRRNMTARQIMLLLSMI